VTAAPALPDHDPQATALAALVKTFRDRLHLPDLGALYATLGAVAANWMRGDPIWLLLVGPPSSGKTELVGALAKLPHTRFAALLTEAALLSGTSTKERAKGAKGGLLREIDAFGILLMKDFTSTLAQNRDTRAQTLSALREIYDGHWSRPVGTEGGKVLHWSGKVGLVAGVTPAIDAHHAVLSELGDRFIFYRLPPTDAARQGKAALDLDDDGQMRAELAAAVAEFFAAVKPPDKPPKLQGAEQARMIALATLAARCRSAVERDGRTRELLFVPEAEPPARLAKALWRLLEGVSAIGVDRQTAWQVVTKTALDCMPSRRRIVLEILVDETEPTTTEVAERSDQPTPTVRLALEDLTAHRLAARKPQGRGKADRWRLTGQARSWWEASTKC
jgi:hypothetical protein